MILVLTDSQAALVLPLMQPGRVLLGRVMREPFDGTNAATCGRLILELGTVPEKQSAATARGHRESKQTTHSPRLRERTPN